MKNYLSLAIMLSLLSGKRYSASALAEKYEVSVKTIYRSIDLLLEAGMPIVSRSGKDGGYELISQSLVTSSFFTAEDFGALKSLSSVTAPLPFAKKLSDKIESIKDQNFVSSIERESHSLVIDTASWGSNSTLSNYSKEIMQAIRSCERLIISYQDNPSREIEPYTLVFKAGSWYVYAFSTARGKFRLFKVSRIKNLKRTNQTFVRQNIDTLSMPWNSELKQNLEQMDIKLECSADCLEDVSEWISNVKILSRNSNKMCLAGKVNYSLGLLHRIMEYGTKIKILSPEKIKNSLLNECNQIVNCYN